MSPKYNTKNLQVTEPTLPKTQKIKFSFEYYDTSNKYCLSSWSVDRIKKTLDRLKNVNTKTFNDLRRERYVYHFSEVIWEKTIEKNGFPDSRTKHLPAFHFSLLGVNDQLARVYGVFSEDTFYVVWFDLDHKIWPTPLKNT